ncbi:MAG: peroxiredoxin family protein [Candidatus Aminicenantes bacterium]|nr:peroxiredoxin family protein [Candidatus Aminicenantes bacterium]
MSTILPASPTSYLARIVQEMNWEEFPLPGWERGGVRGKHLPAEDQQRLFASLEEVVSGSPVPFVAVFFSLSCHVCWDELFEMKEFIEKYHIPVGIVGISRDSPDELRAFSRRYSFFYPIVCDERKQLYRRFKVKLEPYRIILEKGKVLYEDDLNEDFVTRRDKIKRCLLAIASR